MKLASEPFAIRRIFPLMTCVVPLILFCVLTARYLMFLNNSDRNLAEILFLDYAKIHQRDCRKIL